MPSPAITAIRCLAMKQLLKQWLEVHGEPPP